MENNSTPSDSQTKKIKKPLTKRIKILILLLLTITPLFIVAWIYAIGPYIRLIPKTYMVEMRDGVKLATDVYTPEGKGPFPYVLFRTPYGKAEGRSIAQTYLKYGVGIICQDHRGCHDSQGNYTGFGSDGPDAEDTVKWMKTQKWFNGKYATYGGSARGITQYMQVPYLDDVMCQYIQIATADLYSIAMWQGGVPRKQLAEDWLNGIKHGDYYNEIFNHPFNNDSYAKDHRIDDDEWIHVTWPSIHMGGWYDCFGQGIIDGFMGYQYRGGVGGAGNAKLVMGPWTHDICNDRSGEVYYPSNARSNPADVIFNAMFAEKLLGYTGYGDYRMMNNVTYYVMGDVNQTSTEWNRWAKSDVWPLPYYNQSLYFQPDLSLSITNSSISQNLSYLYNPTNPIATRGGANLNTDNRGSYDQNIVETGRTDLIKFETAISSPLLITGRIWAHLFVTSNCTDTDFTVKLCDVYPNGRSMLIADGIIRMRSRYGQDKSVLMDGTGNTVYEVYIDLWSTSYVFNAGHKMRISVSSSNFPRFDVNTNTGGTIVPFINGTTSYNIANNAIIIGPSYISSIILPIPLKTPDFI